MRTYRPVKALIFAVLSLVLVPASALAFPHRHHPRPHTSRHCLIGMSVAPREIVAGEAAIVFGRLRCVVQGQAANQEVKLYRRVYGTPGFAYLATVTTDAHGYYQYTSEGPIESNRWWYARSGGAVSHAEKIRVAAQVTLSGPPEGQLLTGYPNRVTFSGTVSPADAGARVILQRQSALSGNRWHRIDAGAVDVSGNFTIVHRFIVPGDANIRVLVRSQGRNVPSSSNVLAYSISQAQNPSLTIEASADPISFGESVAISGKAQAAGKPVTLLARTVHQRGYARVAEASTGPAGEYSFPAQSPINSTFYRVVLDEECASPHHPRHCTTASAVLYEGVRDVLSTQLSSNTVQAGQSVAISGTVAPDHSGHVIYLERQNAVGNGFHVIQVAYVGAGSSYSIVHRLYVPGTKVLRVFVPGGPENQGAASSPLTVQITPAPSSTLSGEPAGNSTQPSEGES